MREESVHSLNLAHLHINHFHGLLNRFYFQTITNENLITLLWQDRKNSPVENLSFIWAFNLVLAVASLSMLLRSTEAWAVLEWKGLCESDNLHYSQEQPQGLFQTWGRHVLWNRWCIKGPCLKEAWSSDHFLCLHILECVRDINFAICQCL